MGPTVYFVIPCYNEEEVLPETVRRLTEKLDSMRAGGLANEKKPYAFGGRRQPRQDLGNNLGAKQGEPLCGGGEAGP